MMKKYMVSYIGYSRWCDPLVQGVKTYCKNSLKEALEEILQAHSYGLPKDNQGNKELQTVEELLLFLHRNNGDRCDFIISIICDDKIIYDCSIEKEGIKGKQLVKGSYENPLDENNGLEASPIWIVLYI
jgi:hypothetical protein